MSTNNSAHTQAISPKSKLLWYEIESVLGQGGFGITYLARDPNLDQHVAIKEYLPSAFASRDIEGQVKPLTPDHESDYRWGLERFIDEGRTLARFDHPGIVRVLSVFEKNSTAYLVMRYEKGESMSAILKRQRTIAEPHLRQIMGEIMDGLEQVHEAGFIHRDIKPANIYVRENGSAVLLDFGAARQALGIQTQTLTTLVSPGYAPFEQYYSDGSAQGPWTDIYALGATAYRSITGKAPLPAVDRSQMLINGEQDTFLTTLEIGAAGYSPDFLRAVDKALAFRDTDRPRSIAQWREILDTTSASSSQSIENPTLQRIPTDRPSDDYAATEVIPITESEAPTQVFDVSGTETNSNRFAKWFNRKIVAGAAVALIALLLIVSNGEEQETTKTVESVATDGRKIGPVVDKVIPAPPPAAPAEADDRINSLLARAADDLVALRLTTPKNNNAYDKYRTVLLLDPSNTTARRGVDQIVEKYIQLADRSLQINDFSSARAHIERAASIQPDHPMVQRARANLTRRVEVDSLSRAIAEQAANVTDKSTRRKLSGARKALRKEDYGKALNILRDVARDSQR